MKENTSPQTAGSQRSGGCCAPSLTTHTQPARPDDADAVRELVRQGYARVATSDRSGAGEKSRKLGYSDEQLTSVPEDANLGVGCGNPTAIDSLSPGQVVVDLGAGAGLDAFLAARAVGPQGRVIGIDMTDEMLEKARANACKGGYTNVEFRKGYIEDLPIDDACVDVILSNCVINLSPDKPRVYAEAYRVLKPGGRIMISDVVLAQPLPRVILDSVEAYVGCVGGAILRDDYLKAVATAGFRNVEITSESSASDFFSLQDEAARETIARLGISAEQARTFLGAVKSIHLRAVK